MKEHTLHTFTRGKGRLIVSQTGGTVRFRVWHQRGTEKGYKATGQTLTFNTREIPQLIQALQNITTEVNHE